MKWPGMLMLIAITLFQCGYSTLIARSGKNVEIWETREQIREVLGTPMTTGIEEGREFDDFVTCKKIEEDSRIYGLSVSFAMTCGFSEFITFPNEAYRAIRNMIVGTDLRFYYDANGRITGMDSRTIQVSPRISTIRSASDADRIAPAR